jgi:hypothetical protein
MTPLQVATEEYLAREYREPKAYWHCTKQLNGSSYYTFDEINYPQYWLSVVAKYIQGKPSAAAKQLHRRVEEHRAEFRAKLEKIYGDRSLYQVSRHKESIEAKELSAWNTFNVQRQARLKQYQEAIKTGVVARKRTGRKCKQCGAARVIGRAKYCAICIKQRSRESTRRRRAKQRPLSDDFSVLQPAQDQPLTKVVLAENGHLATTIAEGA